MMTISLMIFNKLKFKIKEMQINKMLKITKNE